MIDREKVLQALEHCDLCSDRPDCLGCDYLREPDCTEHLKRDIIALLKAQELRHRLEVHNIGNVDVPEGVTWEQFQAVMSGVVKALECTDRGESWPYDEDRR